jgi:hypothetical protein
MAEEKELRQKQLEELEDAAQVVANMVDPPEERVVDNRTLLEPLHEAPQKNICLYLGDHQDLCGACPWARQVLFTKGKLESTG